MTTASFIRHLRFEELPEAVVTRAKLALLDTLGVAVAGLSTELSRIVRGHAVRTMAAGEGAPAARVLFDGRRASPAGAAFAGASTIDSFDAHDGHALTKGHAGVAVLPALLAVADAQDHRITGPDLLTALVLGYEVATRAGIALHQNAAAYHTSGAWNALGCAAVAARLGGFDEATTRHALGIAEYHGPRSPMMRVIAHPTMLKDGSGWGALAGLAAADLAAEGFTGAPAETVEAEDTASVWADLGSRWRLLEQYVKPQPVCRWAQPAIEAALALREAHAVDPADVLAVEVQTFAAAVALGVASPASTEAAQYALGFPLAAALVRGRVGASEIAAEGLADQAIAAMLGRIRLTEDPSLTARFPAERRAVVTLRLPDGRELRSPVTGPRGDPEAPLPESEMRAKFCALASALPAARRDLLEATIDALDRDPAAGPRLLDAVLAPPNAAGGGRRDLSPA